MRLLLMAVAMVVVVGLLDIVRVPSGTIAVVIDRVVTMTVRVVMRIGVVPLVPMVTGLPGVMVMGMRMIDVVVVVVLVAELGLVTDEVELG